MKTTDIPLGEDQWLVIQTLASRAGHVWMQQIGIGGYIPPSERTPEAIDARTIPGIEEGREMLALYDAVTRDRGLPVDEGWDSTDVQRYHELYRVLAAKVTSFQYDSRNGYSEFFGDGIYWRVMNDGSFSVSITIVPTRAYLLAEIAPKSEARQLACRLYRTGNP